MIETPGLCMEFGGCSDYEVDGFIDELKALLLVFFVILERLRLREWLSLHLLCNEPLGLDVIAVRVKSARNE